MILRDPFNLVASRLEMGCRLSPKVAPRMWKQHARAALQEGQPQAILYNRWAADPHYRRDLADDLGIRFSDAGRDRVARCAGGSSFDGTAYDGRAGAMPTNRRWHAYVDEPRYLRLFDEEMVRLSERLFGPAPREILQGLEEFVGA